MPKTLGQTFHRDRLKLTSGGVFDFDAVSGDGRTAASISTSSAATASGRSGMGKLLKIRSDMLFLLLSDVERRLIVLTEESMYKLCLKEAESGRAPRNIEFLLAVIPPELVKKLDIARAQASREVSPTAKSR